MSAADPKPPPPPHRWRKRFLIPGIVLGVLLLLLAAAVVRGTWADSEPKDPAGPEDGVVCRLYRPPGGEWQVRCAVVLEQPLEEVWAAVTDYDHFGEIFPTLKSVDEVERRPDGSVRLTGEARSAIGTWPYDIVVTHARDPGRRVASWEGGSGRVRVLRGSWEVKLASRRRTLLVYASHVEIKGYPDWLVVNALLLRQPKVVRAVADWLGRKD